MRMRHIVICVLYGCTIFFLISWTARFSEQRKLLNTKCVFWYSVQLLSGMFLILRRIQPDIITNVHWSSCKVPVFLVICYWNFKFLERIFEKLWDVKFHETFVHWEPNCCMRTDRQTWRSQCSLFTILRTRLHTFWWRYWGPKMATVTRVVSYTPTIDNALYAV
jgi:hypothetical protein